MDESALPEIHDACLCVPEMADEQYARLVESIAEYGVLSPIELYEGRVIAGRHRMRAGMESGRLLPGDFRDRTTWLKDMGIDPWQYVATQEVDRRHMTKGQIAKTIAKLLKRESTTSGKPISKKRRKKMAEAGGVSDKLVRTALRESIAEEGVSTPEDATPPDPQPVPEAPSEMQIVQPNQHPPAVTDAAVADILDESIKAIRRVWRRLQTIPETTTRTDARRRCMDHMTGLLSELQDMRTSLATESQDGTKRRTSRRH